MKKYVSDWGSNEAEWMESAKLFEDACTEVYSQNEVLKQYPTSALNRTVTDARWGFGDDCMAINTARRTVSARRVRKPWWDSSRQVVSNSTSDNLAAIRLAAKPQSAQTTPCTDDEMQSMRPWETDHVGTWEYAGPGYGWFRQSHKQTAEQFRSWLDKHPEYVTMAPPDKEVSLNRWHAVRYQLIALQRQRLEETHSMFMEDVRWEEGQDGRRAERIQTEFEQWAQRRMRNVAEPFKTKVDSNMGLQESDPTWYGPYLQEGERYAKERTAANVREAAVQMGIGTMVDDSAKERVLSMVHKYWVLFDGKMRSVHGVELRFDFPGVKPISMHPHRWSPAKRAAAKCIVDQFVKEGIMSPVQSEWGFPGVMADKPSGDPPYRLCIDLRKLNEICPKDTFEPPSCDDCLCWLADRPFRTIADARWGFHQLKLHEETRKVFTLVTPFGTYCYNRMVMGWINATAEFQRHMNVTMGDALWRCAIVMVDDICVGSPTLDVHLQQLEEVFSRLAARGHSLKPSKVKLLQQDVEYLGHISTPGGGVKITPGQRKAILAMPYPLDEDGNVMETSLRSFIGLANFSRRYVENFALLTYRLNDLLRKDSNGIWTLAHIIAFDAIKYDIAWSKGLVHIDYRLPIYICTDACKEGIGGYLYQKHEGSSEEQVVLYFSRSCSKDERKWDTRELELLAAIATLEHMQYYIDGQRVTLETDHNNLRWIMNIKNPQGKLARWITRLSCYDVHFVYRKGECNEVADCVSRNAIRLLLRRLSGATQRTLMEVEKDLQQMHQVQQEVMESKGARAKSAVRYAEVKQLATAGEGHETRGLFMMSMCEVDEVDDSSKRLDSYVQEEKAMDEQQLQKRAIRLANIPFSIPSEQVPVNLSLAELRRGQQDDAQCTQWREMLETWKAGGAKAQDKPAEVRGFALTDDGVLMKMGYIGEEGEREVLRPVAPANLRPFIMHNHHASVFAVHHGAKTTLHWIRSRFWWPKMREEICQFVGRCKVCQMAKALKPANQGLLRGRRHSMAMNELCMDLVGPISAATGHDKHSQPLYIFVAIDPFTHMIWLECLPAKGGGGCI